MSIDKAFASFANKTARVTGSPWAFGACLAVVILWAMSGPAFRFSETWQLVINTGTTIVTFLMVFLIQNTQNRDGAAIQAKLDDLILTSDAENDFIGIEKLTERELRAMHDRCVERARKHDRLHAKVTQEMESRAQTRKRRPPTRRPTTRRPAARKAG